MLSTSALGVRLLPLRYYYSRRDESGLCLACFQIELCDNIWLTFYYEVKWNTVG